MKYVWVFAYVKCNKRAKKGKTERFGENLGWYSKTLGNERRTFAL